MILHHPAFYANLDEPDMVKPPIVFVAAGLRNTRRFIKNNSWSWLLDKMGQVPFYPPNVSGWKQGPAFLNTNTAHAYWQTTDYLLDQTIGDPGTQTPQVAVTAAISALCAPLGLERHAGQARDLRHRLRHPQRADAGLARPRSERQTVIRAMLMAGPDGLLH